MSEVTIKLKDKRKFKFLMELLEQLDFVEVVRARNTKASKEKVLDEIKQGFKEVKMISEGNLKPKSAKAFLDELQG